MWYGKEFKKIQRNTTPSSQANDITILIYTTYGFK